jgi:tetratricopeptide (TPR) repeat protein
VGTDNPVRFKNSHAQAQSAVVFVHGFTGDGVGTWGDFPKILQDDPELGEFDCFYWQYPSKLKLSYAVTKWIWQNDPGIKTLGDGLRALLNDTVAASHDYSEIKLVAHSMGGLVVQAYVVEELRRIREGTLELGESMLRKVNEIVLFASPSGGLRKARFGRFLKNQIADMSDAGPFITNLRQEWTAQVDNRRNESNPLASFRLTAVAGMRDRFVPPESALDPFPFDEHVLIPGNHVGLVKPEKVGRQPIDVLVRRMTRPAPTGEELRVIYGHSPAAVKRMNLVQAAAEGGDVDTLIATAEELLADDPAVPTVERALGLALGRQSQHTTAEQLLRRYLDFTLEDDSRPFAEDIQVIQQLAIAQSGLGQHTAAVATLKSLPGDAQIDPETLGITAGRIKRRWLESGPPRKRAIARQALDTYRAGYEAARASGDNGQVLYNGINLSFMSFALGESHLEVAQAVLDDTVNGGDEYWAAATQAEALLLLERFAEAETAYQQAFDRTLDDRYLATTGLQAYNIVDLMGSPDAAQGILAVFAGHIGDRATLEEHVENIEQDRDEAEAPAR